MGLIIDNFAGGGGASTGIEMALRRPVDVAINHDRQAIAMHKVNHPRTKHLCEDVWNVDPLEVAAGQKIDLAWFSPDCKHFSKAKGGKPVEKKIRGLAWVAIKWAELPEHIRPDIIALENVEEFQDWGPLDKDNKPCPMRKGFTFRRWVSALKKLGYKVEWKELRACDYGAPTIRKRLFVIARCDGKAIVWPTPTHGKGYVPYRTAADCIDWSIPCPSIFERKKPLAENTLRRIARGIQRYVIDAKEPFIVRTAHGDSGPNSKRWGKGEHSLGEPLPTVTASTDFALVSPTIARIGQTGGNGAYTNRIDEPLTTITSKAEHLLISPTLIQTGYGEREGQAPRSLDLNKPLGTVVAGGSKHALVSAFLAQHNTGVVGRKADAPLSTVTGTGSQQQVVLAHIQRDFGQSVGHGADEPLATTTSGGGGKSSLVSSHLLKLYGSCKDGQPVDEPVSTIRAQGTHIGEVRAFLIKYFGTDQDPRLEDPMHTVTSKDRFGLVTVHGEEYIIVDIGMRMLTPRELFRAQGFPDSYIIDHEDNGKPITKTAQVRMCGNSVCPDVARAIIEANFKEQEINQEDRERA